MSASPFIPIRWTPVPVTASSDRGSSCSSSCNPQTRRDVSPKPRGGLLRSVWARAKQHLPFGRPPSHHRLQHLDVQSSKYWTSSSSLMLPGTFTSEQFTADEYCPQPGYYMSGAICGRCHGSKNIAKSGFQIDMDSTQLGPKRSFERDWKEIRQRLERKIAAAAAQAISARPGGGGGEIRKPRWPLTPPKSKVSRTYELKMEDKLTKRGANPRTGMISPSNRTDSSQEDSAPRPRVSQKWKVKGNQWISVDVTQSPSSASPSSESQLSKTVSSAGSESTNTSSEGWEDRFVVNMPSAQEPNPPTMTDEEIRIYQEKKEKLHADTIKRHEMDASKPKSSSEYRNTPHPKKMSSIPVLQKETTVHPVQTSETQQTSPRSDGSRHYYSPDEVGRTRISPLSDEPKLKQKDLYHKLRQECFMGCMGMDQAGAKNPDEVLLFPNLDDEDAEQHSPSPAPKSRSINERARRPGILPVPQSPSRIPQISGQQVASNPYKTTSNIPSTSRPAALTIPSALTAAHTTKIPKPSSGTGSPLERSGRKQEEDVFISTSSVTRVAPKPITRATIQASRTRPAPENLAQKSSTLRHNITTPENDLFFCSSSDDSPTGLPHSPSNQEYRSASISPDSDDSVRIDKRDFAATSDGRAPISAPTSADSVELSPSDIFKNVPGRGPPLHEIYSPAEERARNELLVKKQRTPKTPSVAELDSLQVPQQLPSPPLSTSPSPPAVPSKPREGKERKDTRTIRMEIRMKAEKARQGAEDAKSASSRLMAARQHAERLAEARAAYDRVKAQSSAQGMRAPMDELREQKLNTERINEARKAYKAAKAKEKEAEAEKQAKEAQSRAAEVTPKSTASASSAIPRQKPSVEAKPACKPRRSGAQRRAPSQTENNHNNNQKDDPGRNGKRPADKGSDEGGDSVPDVNLSPGVLYLQMSLINLYDLLHDKRIYSDVLYYSQKLPQMAFHCFKVCKSLAEAWIEYKQTGSLPRSCTDDFGKFTQDIGQALVNFVVLGFVLIVVGKAVGYIIIVASWIAWFCRPFGWIFGKLSTVGQ